MIWGPFDLLVDVPCLMCGGVLGALVMALVVVGSAGHPSQADDRDSLANLLLENGVANETVKTILQKGLTKWALWRWKSRPLLWRWEMDWPEYLPLLQQELEQYCDSMVPASPPSTGQSVTPEQAEALPDGMPVPLDVLQNQNAPQEQLLLEQPGSESMA